MRNPDGLVAVAGSILSSCQALPGTRLALVHDGGTAPRLLAAFDRARAELDQLHDTVLLDVGPRLRAFAELPAGTVDLLLRAELAIDLTSVPWLYSDSFAHYVKESPASGSRLALVWGDAASLENALRCPPSVALAARSRAALLALRAAELLRIRSGEGCTFDVELEDPKRLPRQFIGEPPLRAGQIGAPLYQSITVPFTPGTARGRLAVVGAGRFQGPSPEGFAIGEPVEVKFEDGRLERVGGKNPVAARIDAWLDAGGEDARRAMDCNFGLDPRCNLELADNLAIHCAEGGIMIGIGRPYEERPEGARKPGYHLDLKLAGTDVDLDGRPFIRGGRYTAESGVPPPPGPSRPSIASRISETGIAPQLRNRSWKERREKALPSRAWISARRSWMASVPIRYIIAAPGNIEFLTASARAAAGAIAASRS
jgi:hypothetical protein